MGPQILGAMAMVTDDEAQRKELLHEGEELLAGGCSGQVYFFFFRHAIECALRQEEWSEAERHADSLAGYLVEPWPSCERLIERGRLLAGYGRGERSPASLARIQELSDECRALELWMPSFDLVLSPKP